MNQLSATVTVCLLILFAFVGDAVAQRPNVVFILSDDQAWTDYGFMEHPHIETPHIDALAKEGMLYERGYVTAPLCRPSLASIVTGLYPNRTGVRGNDPLMPKRAGRNKDKRVFASLRKRMTAPLHQQPSFIKLLSQNGYATLQTGKWWEGNPKDHGFTDAMTHGDETRGGRHGDKGLDIGRKTMKPIYDFVETAVDKEQPFFIWYGVFLPHAPHNAPQRFIDKYKDVAPNESTARYWANVEWFDETCGQLVEHLKSKGLYENTIFVYTCDNGWVPDPMKPNRFIRSKREPVEAGIRTPIFITHPGKIAPQRDAKTLASNIDIAPTILKACGIEPPAEMTGLDLRDAKALNKRNQVYVEVYEHDSDLDQLQNLDHGLNARVVVSGWDKLTVRPDRVELYDLKTDPDDRIDLSTEQPAKTVELTNVLADWVQTARADRESRSTSAFQELKTELKETWPDNRSIRLVFHGHSVPAGYFKTPAVRRLDSYPALFHKALCEQYSTATIDVCTTAIGGENSEQGSARFANDVLSLQPDVVFIDYCLNDRQMGVEAAESHWREMIKQAIEQQVKVVLLTPTPDAREDILDAKSELAGHANSIRTLGIEFNVPVVDSYAAFQELARSEEDISDYLSQSNHPNRRGHEIVANLILEHFQDEDSK